jgi:cyclase
MAKVTPNVFAFTDYRGCDPGYVVTSDGVVVIDTPQLVTKVVSLIDEASALGPIRYLINTEHHIDHIFGNHWFAGVCPVVAHRRMVPEFWLPPDGRDPYEYSLDIIQRQDPEGLPLMPGPEEYIVNRPSITFDSMMSLRVGDHTFDLYHTPGHTRGQIAVHVPQERVLFVGDTVFAECQTWFHSSHPGQLLEALAFLQTFDVDYIVPGHGPVVPKAYLAKQKAFIYEWIEVVATALAAGLSKDECVARISFFDRYPVDIGQAESGPFIQESGVRRIYDYLNGEVEAY